MNKFTNKDISDYYEQTEIHYRRAWDLENSLAMHYGYWREDTRNFRQSLQHMNEEMAKFAFISKADRVLDAGCGVGGTSLFLAKHFGCRVTGISITASHITQSERNARAANVEHLTRFECKDYTQTGYPDGHFDIVWALESFIHANDKPAFIKEAFRILKPGGRLIIGDYFRKESPLNKQEKKTLEKWLHAWAISSMPSVSETETALAQAGFRQIQFADITSHIRPSAWRQFYGSMFLRVLSGLYRLYNPRVRPFADKHYQGLHYQYVTLRKNIWKYNFARAVK